MFHKSPIVGMNCSRNKGQRFFIPEIMLLIFCAGLFACQGEQGAGNRNTNNANVAHGANTVEVRLTEFNISMPSSIPPGPTAFKVTNVGTVEHNFEIEGQGIEKEFERNLKPGETQTLEVDLKPGSYKIYCPVATHEQRGMSMQLTVSG